jgi:hypothetical protein
MFRALLAHPQEALNKRHLVYCVRVLSGGCTRVGVELGSRNRTSAMANVHVTNVNIG